MKNTKVTGSPCKLRGEITPPGDKSISHRAVMIGSLAEGRTIVKGFLNGGDTISTVNAFRNLGIKIKVDNTEVEITGNGLRGLREPGDVIDAGNSGTTTRLITGLLASQDFFSVITGDRYLRKRPMDRIVKPLSEMGASISGRNSGSLLPIAINGKILKGIKYELPVASAQVKSCLILAGLFADGETVITEPQKTRDHTERMLAHFGAQLEMAGNTIRVKNPPQFKGSELIVPSDISSASFFIIAALINPGSELLVKNVGLNPRRTGVLEILKAMNGNISIQNERTECGEPVGDILVKHSSLKGVEIKGEMIPNAIDELPVVSVAACFAEGTTVISEARELRVKETDRIKAMTTELKKLGADISETDDGMIIKGQQSLSGSKCNSWGDHRIAMSLAVAATMAKGETVIEDSDCVSISFPEFFNLLEKLRS